MTEPDLSVLPYESYIVKLRQHVGDLLDEVWYYRYLGIIPRAYYNGEDIIVMEGNEDNIRLLAHEYGHAMGLKHEPWWKFDMMSPHPPRVFDRHGIMPRYRAWREGLE